MAGCSEKLIVVSGSEVSLRICNLPDKYKKLTWFYTDTQKIVEWESNTPEPHYFKSKFKDRVTFDHRDGTLHIYKVQKEDNSTYLLKILKEAGTEVERKIFLQVLGEFGESKGKFPLCGPGWTSRKLPGDHGGSLWEEERKIPGLPLFNSPCASFTWEWVWARKTQIDSLGMFKNSSYISKSKI